MPIFALFYIALALEALVVVIIYAEVFVGAQRPSPGSPFAEARSDFPIVRHVVRGSRCEALAAARPAVRETDFNDGAATSTRSLRHMMRSRSSERGAPSA